ncbi:universal stress protein [Nocardioides sp. BGMRC 2183]|nr:universal stress protein [Nocardioides sp. BGMRC 2183]
MSTIVVGVDGSETATQAAATAARIATALNADLLVVSAFPTYAVPRAEATDADALTTREAAEQTALVVAEQVGAAHPGLVVNYDAEPGKPGEALVQVAEAKGADLIVVGNKRVQGVARVLGNVAGDVVRKAPCDVYIAHTHG